MDSVKSNKTELVIINPTCLLLDENRHVNRQVNKI